MKIFPAFLTVLLGFAIIAPEIDAREARGGGSRASSGRSQAKMPSRSSSQKRSPMTGSKVSRPQSRPAPKPVARPTSRPAPRPQAKPASRPSIQRPTTRPSVERPSSRPSPRPDIKPGGSRPEKLPPGLTRPGGGKPEAGRPGGGARPGIERPDNRPSLERPKPSRPSTLPGMVTYPNRPANGKPGRPGIGDRPTTLPAPGTRPGIGNRPGGGTLPGIGNRPGGGNRPGLSRPSTRPIKDRDWDRNKWGGNHGIWGNNNKVNININNNFKNNFNYSYRPNYWGGRPWWGAGSYHNWHHGHWGYGWNSHYYHRHWWCDDHDFASGFMWGIAVWSLGNMIYDMGYQSYRNPYPAPPVQNTYVTYAQPVSVAAAANPPGDEEAVKIAETKSNEALDRSRTAFRNGDYLAASKAVDEALGYTPGDVTLHEYRALVFFALGKYSEAAGVLNPVLASGPGWSWDTMIGFYNDSGTYSDQLRKLEAYVNGSPTKADGHFLLGYHYMVCGYMDKANAEFTKAVELQPADSISRQLRDLTADSIPDDGETDAEPPTRPDPVPPEKLIGTWVSDRGADGKVTFTMTDDGNYTWNYMNGGQSSELKGTYSLNDLGLLVLSSDDSQMISEVSIKDDKQMHFTLVGAPDGDPGLDFVRN